MKNQFLLEIKIYGMHLNWKSEIIVILLVSMFSKLK